MRALSPPDAEIVSAAPARAHRVPCFSWRAPRRRYCPDARVQQGRCGSTDAILNCMQPLLNIAVRAARRAGEIIVRSLSRLDSPQVASQGRNDFVTEVDRAAEREIIAVIHKAYPDHAILAEESGASGDDATRWIIDLLDGTKNFVL